MSPQNSRNPYRGPPSFFLSFFLLSPFLLIHQGIPLSNSLSVSYSAPRGMTESVSLYQPHLHIRWQCLPLSVILNTIRDGSVCLSESHWTSYKRGLSPFLNFIIAQTLASASACHIQHNTRRLCWPLFVSFSIILPLDVIKPRRAGRPNGLTFSSRVGMLQLMPWHKPTELAHSFLFRSCVSFRLYGPFDCISFYTLPTTLRFLTLFYRSYFCLIGPLSYISLYRSLPQPLYKI